MPATAGLSATLFYFNENNDLTLKKVTFLSES